MSELKTGSCYGFIEWLMVGLATILIIGNEMIEFLIELGKRYGEILTFGYITDEFLLFSIGWGVWIVIVSFAVWLILRSRNKNE